MKTLILGGVRSGKSRLAEALALQSGLPVTYIATAGRYVIVDCLTLWLTQLLCAGAERLAMERDALMELLPTREAPLVSNETGLGIVPLDALSRRFNEEAGRLHQALAGHCDRVVFTVAGLPLVLKGKKL